MTAIPIETDSAIPVRLQGHGAAVVTIGPRIVAGAIAQAPEVRPGAIGAPAGSVLLRRLDWPDPSVGRTALSDPIPGGSVVRPMNTFIRFVSPGLMACLGLAGPAVAATVEADVAIPMRDGVVLRGDVMRPAGAGPYPVLVYRTPYGKADAAREYTTFDRAVERGYAVVIVDVRGRYASAGEFAPYQNEAKDGYDTIEWAARQAWSNGRIGTFGLSYPGAVQWLAAVENPPHLVAMVPAMTFSSYRNFFYAGGTWDLSWLEWIWDNIAPDIRVKRNLPGPRTPAEAEAEWPVAGPRMQASVPLGALPELKGIASYYYEWLSHPPEDPWWNWADLTGKYGRTSAAVLNLSGWYDDNYGPEGATKNFRGLIAARHGRIERNELLIGPWVHGVQSTMTPKAGERTFAANAAIDYDKTVLDWMDHYIRGIDNGVGRRAPVRYYVMGSDSWKESATWPPAATPTSYFLSAGPAGQGGSLSTARAAGAAASSFTSDPAKPVINPYSTSGAHDYRALTERTDLLTFDSAPLPADTEVTGPIDIEVYASCDCRDFDLWVRLYDVTPDGTAWNLMSPGVDVQRASYRQPGRGRQLLDPGAVVPIRLRGPVTSNVFHRGDRIRVQVSGSFFPSFSRNPQDGSWEATSATGQPASIHVLHDSKHASRVVLPIVGVPTRKP